MLEQLLKHARKYGPEGVVDAAVQLRLGLDVVTALIQELDKLERETHGRWATKHRITAEDRARRAMGLPDSKDAA